MPKSNGAPEFAFATMGGAGFAAMGPLKRILLAKGYTPVGATQAAMPSNLWYKEYDSAKTKKRTDKGLAHVRRFANALAGDKARWLTIPLLWHLLHPALTSKRLWSSAPHYVK